MSIAITLACVFAGGIAASLLGLIQAARSRDRWEVGAQIAWTWAAYTTALLWIIQP